MQIFRRLVNQDHNEHQGEMRYLTTGGTIRIVVRRNYLYEDAFEKLSPENGKIMDTWGGVDVGKA